MLISFFFFISYIVEEVSNRLNNRMHLLLENGTLFPYAMCSTESTIYYPSEIEWKERFL